MDIKEMAMEKAGEIVKGSIKEKADEIVKKVKSDKDFAKKFTSNPVKAIEEVSGIDLPDEQINKLVDSVKSKVKPENVIGKIGEIAGGKKD